MMRRCVIVGAGEVRGEISISENDFVIAADGGYEYLEKMGVTPDVLIGDFDSIEALPQNLDAAQIIRHPVEKDETDMYLAYKVGVQNGCCEFYVYGGTGGREDHTFANYCLLLDAINEGKHIFLMGVDRKIFVIKNEKIELDSSAGKTLSVFAFGADAHGVTLRGVKYEAENITLRQAFPRGVSNSVKNTDTRAEISVGDGALLVMLER